MRLVLAVLTTTALLSGATAAWADDGRPSVPAAAPSAATAPGTSAEAGTGTTATSSDGSDEGDGAESGADGGGTDQTGTDPRDLLTGSASAPTTHSAQQQATEALTTVQQVFAPKSDEKAAKQAESGVDPTLALRDLSLRMSSLARADRNTALAQFQRPWDDSVSSTQGAQRQCSGNICLHWATSSSVTGSVGDISNSTWAINTVLPVVAGVSATYQAAGYRTPKADSATEQNPYSAYNGQSVNWGGSAQTDIYLEDLGGQGIYGYCAYDLDDSGRVVYAPTHSEVPAFCVLDNDFALSQYHQTYAGETPTDMLEVTAAHEYFHAVQFSYDALEDAWFMEATATWAEHQLYPAIPDNRQFLPYSQLRFPTVSLDTWNANSGFLQYGDWIFFQYLTQRIGTRTGALPDLVLSMWQHADSYRGSADEPSVSAIASALTDRHVNFTKIFAQYAEANRRPSTAYQAGVTGDIPAATPRGTYVVRAHKKRSGAVRVNHLASATVRFKPHKIKAKSHKATIRVEMAKRSHGSAAMVTVFLRNGHQKVKRVHLNKAGNGKVRVPFSTTKVSYVELTLVNASRAYRDCSSDAQGFSCGGRPVHNHVKEKWKLSS